MKYICVDRGSERCPCSLMEAGQCYTCTMIQKGICDCGQAAGWRGVCPYTEFIQQGGKVKEPCRSFQAEIIEYREYSRQLTVVKVRVSRGFAEKCRFLGTFIMAEAFGYKTPLSVLSARKEETGWTLHFAVKPAGPKTLRLLKQNGGSWRLTGPYYGGLLNSRFFRPEKENFVIGKGTAVAPFLSAMEQFGEKKEKTECYLDMENLTQTFAEDYMGRYHPVPVRLGEEEEQAELREKLKEAVNCGEKNVFLLVSPYYIKKMTEGIPDARQRIIQPNPANMCCGEGICGACSYTDAKGTTIRLCKCNC